MHLNINLKALDFFHVSKQFCRKKNRCFYPTPPRRGVLKKWKFWKLVKEPRLQNMICLLLKLGLHTIIQSYIFNFKRFIAIYHLSMRCGLHTKFQSFIVKIKQFIAIYHLSMRCEISISQNFEIRISCSNYEILVQIFACYHVKIYKQTNAI